MMRPTEISCMLHDGAIVLHQAGSPCPLCLTIANYRRLAMRSAMHISKLTGFIRALESQEPTAQLIEAVKAMSPFTAQLSGGKGITALGHTVEDVVRLGAAQNALARWLNRPIEAVTQVTVTE